MSTVGWRTGIRPAKDIEEPLTSLHARQCSLRPRTARGAGRDRRPRDLRRRCPGAARDAVGDQPADPYPRVDGGPGRRPTLDTLSPDGGRRGASATGATDPVVAGRGRGGALLRTPAAGRPPRRGQRRLLGDVVQGSGEGGVRVDEPCAAPPCRGPGPHGGPGAAG